jgi:hypothetical protein
MMRVSAIRFLMLSLIFTVLPAMAQPGAEEAPAIDPSAARSSGSSDTPDKLDTTPSEEESARGSTGADNSGRSPFDYRSSEEISEDVPVSFPVDI